MLSGTRDTSAQQMRGGGPTRERFHPMPVRHPPEAHWSRCRAIDPSPCPRGWSWCSGRARPSLESTPVCVLLAPTHRAQPRAGGPRAELKHTRVPAKWHVPGGAWSAALAVSSTYFGSTPEVMLQANSAVDLGVKEVWNRMSAPTSQSPHCGHCLVQAARSGDPHVESKISRLSFLNLHARLEFQRTLFRITAPCFASSRWWASLWQCCS